jgi:2-polyprenyl-6-methoxyphenol hydroxylase-like FAD-dependent oxidoreductase
MALEDAIALYTALTTTGDVPAALQAFEQAHRPGAGKLLTIAQQSYTWYETFHEKMGLDPLDLTYSYVTRSGRIDQEALRQKSPRFMARYESYQAASG